MLDAKTSDDVNYQPVASDPAKSCINCKHFKGSEEEDDIGDCFGHKVSSKGTCNYFETK